MTTKRLYIVTGKGGVGKTTHALALTKILNENGKKASYYFFKDSTIKEKNSLPTSSEGLPKQLGIPYQGLQLTECAQSYIAKRLGSSIIAKWIVKTSFFKALINMIPGFNYLIYLGRILEDLLQDPELIAVVDSPSSGHALTMLEATANFREIFSSGIVFEDTQKMHQHLNDSQFVEIHIIALPTSMAIAEASELQEQMSSMISSKPRLVINNQLNLNCEVQQLQQYPDFLNKKLSLEQEALQMTKDKITLNIPHIASTDPIKVIHQIVPLMKNFV